ncbi:helicase-associated domain-containing protein [Catenulispora yoronensis]|uniref:Helicase-associated domain-containing protein n=1 Tax=Catenulispora yoronensis TaxID=450799 RepID=A0ABN2TMN0_9ACTN
MGDPAPGGVSQSSDTAGPPAAPAGAPVVRRRSLADELRSWSADRLAELLAARPDLAVPPPASIAALAERASQRASVALAMDRLDAFTLQVLQALAVSPEPVTAASTTALLGVPDDGRVPEAVATLRDAALVWGPDEGLRPLVNAREALGENPVGLGPPLVSALNNSSPAWLQGVLRRLGLHATADPVTAVGALAALAADPPRMRAVLDQAPAGAEAVLEKLVWGPPFGRVGPWIGGSRPGAPAADPDAAPGPDAEPLGDSPESTAADGGSPLEWLLERGILGRWTEDTVVLPREIAFFLRRHVFGSGLHRDLAADPPAVPVARHDARHADEAAAAAATAAPRRVEELLDAWASGPPGVLRSGGAGIRDLRRTALLLDVSEEEAAFFAELAYSAGLVAADLASGFWLPTPAYDRWLDLTPDRRWAELAAAWLVSDRAAGRVGVPDDRNRQVAPLSPEVASWAVPELRRDLLGELDRLPAGGTAAVDALVDRLFWERPRRSGPAVRQLVDWTLREAVWLGLVAPVRGAAGILSAHGRAALLGLPRDALAAALSAALPDPVRHVLIQGDLTAIAPGPLAPDVAREMALVADIESAGAATVYRFTTASVRRAFDAGRAADDLHAFLAEHSLHEIPQALTYLVDDVARRHGRIRVGAAVSYVRADNDAALSEMLADRRTGGLGLRRIAPGVAVSELPPEELLEGLRANGYAPMAENEDGSGATPVVATPRSRRATSFHPYAVQRPALPGSAAVVALAEDLAAGG